MRRTARLSSLLARLWPLALALGCHHVGTAARPGTQLRTGAPSAAATQFGAPTTPPLARLPVAGATQIERGDLDGDGQQDLVVRVDHGLRLFLRTGPDAFAERLDALVASVTAGTVALLDADRDGFLDLVVGGALGQADRLLLNDGHARFTDAPLLLPSTSGLADATAIVGGDLDRDGLPDLVIGRRRSQVQLYLGLATGGFQDTRFRRLPGGTPATTALLLVDLDRDDDLDLLIGAEQPERALLWENDGQGFFRDQSAARLPADAFGVRAAAVLDLDRDGDQDLVVARADGLRVWENDGRGSLADTTQDHVQGNAPDLLGLALADLDGDGDLDLVTSNAMVLVDDGRGRLVRAPEREPELEATLCLPLGRSQSPLPDLLAATGQELLLLPNQGDGAFRPVAPAVGLPPALASADATAIQPGDVDRDGIPDLVLACAGVPSVLIGNGAGGFRLRTDAVPAGLTTHALLLADLDGDRSADLVLDAVWLHNDGTGRFTNPRSLNAPMPVRALLALDQDGDGIQDLLLAGPAGTRLLHNDGTGAFTDQSGLLHGAPAAVAMALLDVDGDADLDLVLGGDPSGGTPRLLLAQGASGFVDRSDRLPIGLATAYAVAAADLDGDGDLDLVTGISSSESTNQFAQVLLGDGTGAFLLRTTLSGTLPGGATARSLALADVDGDHRPDLIAALSEGGPDGTGRAGVTILCRNTGLGLFDVFPGELTGSDADHGSPAVVLAADLDLDLDVDLVVGYQRLATGSGTAAAQTRFNLQRQLLADSQAIPGTSLSLRVLSRLDRSPRNVFALPFLGLRGLVAPVPPFGTWLLDPLGLVALPVVAVESPAGVGHLALPIPDDRRLLGVTLHLQTLLLSLGDGVVELTNAVVEPVR